MLSFQNVTKRSTEAYSRFALSFQRVMHSVISTRMLLHVSGVAEESRDWNNDIALNTNLYTVVGSRLKSFYSDTEAASGTLVLPSDWNRQARPRYVPLLFPIGDCP